MSRYLPGGVTDLKSGLVKAVREMNHVIVDYYEAHSPGTNPMCALCGVHPFLILTGDTCADVLVARINALKAGITNGK